MCGAVRSEPEEVHIRAENHERTALRARRHRAESLLPPPTDTTDASGRSAVRRAAEMTPCYVRSTLVRSFFSDITYTYLPSIPTPAKNYFHDR